MIKVIRHSKGKKELLVALLLVTTFMSFALPRETFDPHLGVDFDIFCQLSSYLNIDPGDLGWISIVLFVPEAPVFNEFYGTVASVFFTFNLPIRAPPVPEAFPMAA